MAEERTTRDMLSAQNERRAAALQSASEERTTREQLIELMAQGIYTQNRGYWPTETERKFLGMALDALLSPEGRKLFFRLAWEHMEDQESLLRNQVDYLQERGVLVPVTPYDDESATGTLAWLRLPSGENEEPQDDGMLGMSGQ